MKETWRNKILIAVISVSSSLFGWAGTRFTKMTDAFTDMQKTMAVVVERVGNQGERLKDHDSRLEYLERRRTRQSARAPQSSPDSLYE